jgi:hypothetical protein
VPLTESEARSVAKDLLSVRRNECERLDKIREYVRGDVCKIFLPKRHTAEYAQLVAMSLINIMPLVISTFAQNLFIEGYRAGRKSQNAKAWELWQVNRMDLLQSALFRTAIEYGLSYTTALPAKLDGEQSAEFRLYSPRMLTAVYDDVLVDEWPVYGLAVRAGYDKDKRKPVRRLTLLDDTHEIKMIAKVDQDDIDDAIEVGEHGMGVTPIVRWQSAGGDLDDQSRGEVEPLMPDQDSLNNTTFGLKSTERSQAFRQRYATGLVAQLDENGNEIEPFTGGQARVWTSDSPDTRFGDFQESDLSGYLDSRQSTLRIITARAQIAPYALQITDGISNLSADALAALEAAQQRKIGEMKTSFGEAAEQLLRLASKASGDDAGWKERKAEVRWRDTESRSLAQLADALGKMAQMLGIPPRALWELLPNVTDQQLQRWDQLADREIGMERDDAGIMPPPDPEEMAEGATGVVPARRPRSARSPVPAGT